MARFIDRFYIECAGLPIAVYSRAEFMRYRWTYKAGQHVSFIAPSQDGKTTLAYQLMMHTAKPTLPAYGMVMKPRDATPAAWSAYLGYPEVWTWPPPKVHRWQQKPAGYTLWPRHTMDVATDNRTMSIEFEKMLGAAYERGDCIVFADEIYGLIAELPTPFDRGEGRGKSSITDLVIAISTRGSGMGCGLWAATQKPSGTAGKGMPGFIYSNAHHLFLSKDPDKRSRDRYAEIGGVDTDLLKQLVMMLHRHQFVYINKGDDRGGPYICIIDAR